VSVASVDSGVFVTVLAGLTVLVSLLGTVAFERYARRRSLLDVPNQRSSHQVPVPRGGGVVIITISFVCITALAANGFVEPLVVLGPPILALALIGWIDDRRGLSARLRFVVHLGAAGWVAATVPDLGALFPSLTTAWAWVAVPIAVLGMVWALNLFNFMDGIDGIAASQCVFISVSALLLLGETLPAMVGVLLVVLVGASVGFLIRNWAPASVFMGDVGSGTIGLFLAALAVWDGVVNPGHVWIWVILWGTFLVDATVTLLFRAARFERVFAAHRSHCYQRLASKIGHKSTTLLFASVNVFWCLPWAYVATTVSDWQFWAVVPALVPLVLVAIWQQRGTLGNSPLV
jgi:Fuc2NAc and GlcNAc transferase